MKRSTYSSSKWSCLKPEDIDIKEVYSFTLSPISQPLQTNLGKMKLNCISDWYTNEIKRSLNRLSNCNISAFTEISSGSRIHYHGTIKINNIANFYFHDIPLLKHLGCYEIDTINDNKIWSDYCLKQKGFMKPFCEFNDIDYKYTNA